MTQLILEWLHLKLPWLSEDVRENVVHTRLFSCENLRVLPHETQGIIPFQIYSSRKHFKNSSKSGIGNYRFDWVELVDPDQTEAFNGVYAQICALFYLETDYGLQDFFFIGASALKQKKVINSLTPFLHYNMRCYVEGKIFPINGHIQVLKWYMSLIPYSK